MSAQEKGTGAQKAPLKVAIREFLPPYVYEKAKSGIEVDLVQAILSEAHIPYRFIQLPRIRMIQSFEDGKIDGLLTQNAEASSVGCVTVPYITHHNLAFTLADRHLKVGSLADLSHYAVISFSGATRYLGPTFAAAIKDSPRYTESGDQGTHIALLYKRRFDVVVGDQWIIRLAQRRYMEKTGVYHELTGHKIMPASHYVARFHDQKYCDAFNQAYADLNAEGTLADIWNSYKARILVDAAPPAKVH
ncbi:substrate-binding periplasmic protein [Kordiimonas marina]|uniref:substrate-binding periplasmic protein n=1 Tax=Kordiimonas marina TaxID=2872312 RepID=UPI001FF244ED|nr:transporter substrate-binding domain-containing protein [Kordiimonas marina]